MRQQTLFPEYDLPSSNAAPARKSQSRQQTLNDYEGFVEKFNPKLTTDDCYTPAPVYDVVLDWVRKKCDIEGCNIVRPFYPGGDYETAEYGKNDVVIDNPPFSIITKIVRFYVQRGIRFFLFAPYLTIFQPGRLCASIITDVDVIYENRAKVKTSFVSNMFGDIAAMTAPDLADAIAKVQAVGKAVLPKYRYPDNVVRATDLGLLCRRGIGFIIPKSDARFITKLDSQGQKGIFGGGLLISDRVAAEKAEADRAAVERAAQVKAIEWTLSERERRIIEELNQHTA